MKQLSAIIVVLIIAAHLACGVALNTQAWSTRADIHFAQPPSAGVADLNLPAAVLDTANPDCSDLRVCTSAGEAVGYVIDTPVAAESITSEPAMLYNRTFIPGTSSRVTVDGSNNTLRNSLEIDTSGANFQRRMLLEGSDDSTNWQVIRDNAMLFRVSENGSMLYNKAVVTFPDNAQRYLRVTVFNGAGDAGAITINGVILLRQATAQQTAITSPIPLFSIKSARQQTVLAATIGFRNLPMRQITLACPESTFFRQVSIYGRNATTRALAPASEDRESRQQTEPVPWTLLGSGAIYRFPGEESLTIGLSGTDSREIRVEIIDDDNSPLHVTALQFKYTPRRLSFQPSAGTSYYLLFGNPAAIAPSYDLAHFIDRLRAQSVTVATISALDPNPALPHSQGHPGRHFIRQLLIWLPILAIFAVLLLLILRQLRTAKPLESEDGK